MEKKDNAKEVLLDLVKKNYLEILKIDCWNYDEDDARSWEQFDPSRPHVENINGINRECYTTLEQLDFLYDDSNCCPNQLYGTVYCIDKNTKQPVWLTREETDIYAYWKVNRIPEFYGKLKRVEL